MKRSYVCKTCNDDHESPMGLSYHYKKSPDHRPEKGSKEKTRRSGIKKPRRSGARRIRVVMKPPKGKPDASRWTYCGHCGTELSSDWHYCTGCGHALA